MKNAIQKQKALIDLWKSQTTEGVEPYLSLIEIFSLIYFTPKISLKQIVEQTKLTYPSASLAIANLSTGKMKRRKGTMERTQGLDLLEVSHDDMDRRMQFFSLNKKGEKLVKEIEKILS